ALTFCAGGLGGGRGVGGLGCGLLVNDPGTAGRLNDAAGVVPGLPVGAGAGCGLLVGLVTGLLFGRRDRFGSAGWLLWGTATGAVGGCLVLLVTGLVGDWLPVAVAAGIGWAAAGTFAGLAGFVLARPARPAGAVEFEGDEE